MKVPVADEEMGRVGQSNALIGSMQMDTSPFPLNFGLDDQHSIFTCPDFNLTFRHGHAMHFCGQPNFSLGKSKS